MVGWSAINKTSRSTKAFRLPSRRSANCAGGHRNRRAVGKACATASSLVRQCPQPVDPLMNLLPIGTVGKMDEDCLYLNVYRPAKPASDDLPVMVWIHGGGYTTGSGSQALYDGANLARKGVVVVTINYRLGAFGFLAHPALTSESQRGTSGNYGILDQIEALRWVQKTSPHSVVTATGSPFLVNLRVEASVICLLVAPEAKGLFHRAIAQSAPVMRLRHLKQDFPGRESAEKVWLFDRREVWFLTAMWNQRRSATFPPKNLSRCL